MTAAAMAALMGLNSDEDDDGIQLQAVARPLRGNPAVQQQQQAQQQAPVPAAGKQQPFGVVDAEADPTRVLDDADPTSAADVEREVALWAERHRQRLARMRAAP
jgi:hypothetical protein